MESKQFVAFAPKNVSGGIGWKFRMAKIASAFTVQARAIGLTLEIVEKKRGAKFRDFLGLGKRAKRH
jgi:hypothetical protein